MTEKVSKGWGWPSNSKKAHYFPENSIMSLCGKWLYKGKVEEGSDDSNDNCTTCKKALQKIRAKEKLKQLEETKKIEF